MSLLITDVYNLVSKHKTLPQKINLKVECGPMSNVMAALPNVGGALCSTPQSLADVDY